MESPAAFHPQMPRTKHTALDELDSLARKYHGSVSLSVDYSESGYGGDPVIVAAFKRPGRALDRVVGRAWSANGHRYPAPSIDVEAPLGN